MGVKNSIASLMKKPAYLIKQYSDSEMIASCNWIDEIYKLCIKFRSIFRNYPIEFFLSPYIEQLKKLFANENVKEKVNKMWMDKFDIAPDDIKMFISKLVFLTNSIQNTSSSKIMNFAQNTDDIDYRYWTAMDISMFTFLASNGFYPNYYNDRKTVLKKIIRERKIAIPHKQGKRNNNNICVITFMYKPHIQSSVQRVVNMVANAMAERADNVMIISLESFYTSFKEGIRINTSRRKTSARLYLRQVKSMVNPKIEVLYAHGNSITERMQDAINKIYNFNPTCILDISDEFSALSELYSRDFPTIYIPLRLGGSSLSYTKIAGTDWMFLKANRKFNNSIDMKKVVNWMFPEYVPPHKGRTISRTDMGINDDSFVIVSVGYNSTAFSNEFVDEMCNLLNTYSNYCWLLVGENGSTYMHKNYTELFSEGKIIERGFEKNLSGLYKSCDILLRSDTTGSSGATAIAAMQGLPIVMSRYECDPMRWLGKDYSDLQTPFEIVTEIKKLCNDKSYYNLKKKQVLQLVRKATDAEYCWNTLFEMSVKFGKRN